MAAKKARKRVYIPPSHEVVNRRERSASTHAQRTAARTPRAQQPYPQPSIQRTLKRLPIYFGMIFALQFFLIGGSTDDTGQRLMFSALQAGIVTVCFAPFMHMMDRFAYNRYVKRTNAQK